MTTVINGFKMGHSTTVMCTSAITEIVVAISSSASSINFSKAFDRVNHWKLFSLLLDDGIESCFVKLFAFWYSNQTVCVLWQNTVSEHFLVGNGTRQGGILSPYLFTKYVRDLVRSISVCNIAGLPLNIVAYADDMLLLAPSWQAMQELLYILDSHRHDIDIACNTNKTVCMVLLQALRKERVVAIEFPCFTLGGVELKFVLQFRHLGHILSNSLNDDDDIQVALLWQRDRATRLSVEILQLQNIPFEY